MSDWAKTEKSAEAYRTISEVAEDLKLPQHVLRFWETRFPQVKPLKRAGGRRFYRPGDVALLRSIKTLLYGQGYTIKGVQRMLREQGPRSIVEACVPGSGTPARRRPPLKHDEDDGKPIGNIQSGGRPVGPGESAALPDLSRPLSSASDGPLEAASDPSGFRDLVQAVAADLTECRRLIAAVRAVRT
ncbi:MAG: MerR family transcriptional regulator [Janthinobacterium lividum]